MEIALSNNIKLNVVTAQDNNDSVPVVFLHGFSGSSSDWLPFFDKLPAGFRPAAVDLIGHGMSSAPDAGDLYTTDSMVSQLNELFERLGFIKIILAGYSMGGRVALSYAAQYPDGLKALILESSTPGIVNELDRKERIKSDLNLADFIEQNPIEVFVDYWSGIPLFNSQAALPDNVRNNLRVSRLKNSPKGLANSLRGFSTGRMPQLWDILSEIKCKTLLITGSLDEKFTRVNKLLFDALPDASYRIIKGAGHNTHLEKPEVFLNLLIDFFKDIP